MFSQCSVFGTGVHSRHAAVVCGVPQRSGLRDGSRWLAEERDPGDVGCAWKVRGGVKHKPTADSPSSSLLCMPAPAQRSRRVVGGWDLPQYARERSRRRCRANLPFGCIKPPGTSGGSSICHRSPTAITTTATSRRVAAFLTASEQVLSGPQLSFS